MRRVHVLDLLALVLAAAAGVIAYSYLFRREAAPRPGDPMIGGTLEIEFPADRPWKRTFLSPGQEVLLEDCLSADVIEAGPAAEGPAGGRRVRLRIRGRDRQQPWAISSFRWGVWRGSTVTVRLEDGGKEPPSVVTAEVVAAEPAKGP